MLCKNVLLNIYCFYDLCYCIIGDIMNLFKFDYLKKLCKSAITYFIFFNSIIFQYIIIILFKIDRSKIKGNYSFAILLSVIAALCVAFILFIIYRKDLVKEFKIFKKNIVECIDTGLGCWVVGLVIMAFSNIIIAYFFKTGGANNENAVQSLIKVSPILMAIDACIIAPFNEEIVFRKAIRDISFNKYIFIFLSFLAFGGAHVLGSANSIGEYLYIIPYGALGAMFAVAYSKTDTFFTSLLFHIIHNTSLIIISIFL